MVFDLIKNSEEVGMEEMDERMYYRTVTTDPQDQCHPIRGNFFTQEKDICKGIHS